MFRVSGIRVVEIFVPPLRERRVDIVPLAMIWKHIVAEAYDTNFI